MTDKLLLLAVLFGGVLIYGLLDPRKNARYDSRTALDGLVPFIPAFAIPYLGLFVFVPVTLLFLMLTPFAVPYLLALSIAMYSAALVWFFFPSKMHPGHPTRNTFTERLVGLLYRGDPHANSFPSAHVFSSLISAYYLSMVFPAYALISWAVGVTIALSTMFVKRHTVLDAVGGMLWATGAVLLATHFVG